MRELQTAETFVVNGKERNYPAGSWVVESALEAETFSDASRHAPGAMTARKFTHIHTEEHNGRQMEVRLDRTKDEAEFWRREVGRIAVRKDGSWRFVGALGPLILSPDEAHLVEAGLKACAQPTELGVAIPQRAVSEGSARFILDILAAQRQPEPTQRPPLSAVA